MELAQAAATDPAASALISLLQYGVLGAVVVGLITGWLWPRPAVRRLIEEKDALAAELREQRKLCAEQTAEMARLRRLIEGRS